MVTELLTATVKDISSILEAIIVLGSIAFAVFKFYTRQKQQDIELKQIREEQAMLCYALVACLDGLKQLGANGNVTKAHDDLSKYINKTAHNS